MALVTTVSKGDLIDMFAKMGRGNQFSNAALDELYDHLESVSEDTGKDIQIDVIALCCEYSEYTLEEFIEDRDIDIEDLDIEDDADEIIDLFRDDYGTVLSFEVKIGESVLSDVTETRVVVSEG